MTTSTNNYQVTVSGTQEHITRYNRVEEFSTYESAVTYFQEMCDMVLDTVPQVCHNPAQEIELFEGGIGDDYRVELKFINA